MQSTSKNNEWLAPYLKGELNDGGEYTSLNVDGGMINNEPFEKVREVLSIAAKQDASDYNDYDKFNSTVVMIEPFPTKKRDPISKKQNLLHLAALTLSAMLSQSRAKPVNIAAAMDPNCSGQFLITPSRKVKTKDGDEYLTGERAIDCGHWTDTADLSTRNSEYTTFFLADTIARFLRNYFKVPSSALKNNPVFASGYAQADKDRFKSHFNDTYQIIPVFENVKYDFPSINFRPGTDWPSLQNSDIDRYRPSIKKRVQEVLMNAIKTGPITKFLLWGGCKVLLNRKLADGVIDKIKSDQSTWKLLPEEKNESQD